MLSQVPTSALTALTTAIYDLQRQMGDLATRVAEVEHRPSSSSQPLLPFGMPGYGGLPPLPPTSPLPILPEPVTTQQVTHPLPRPITQIPFPHSPSPVPSIVSAIHMSPPLPTAAMHMPPPIPLDPPELAGVGVPRFHKLSFLTYDGKEGPLG
jgi:hypothetical protein